MCEGEGEFEASLAEMTENEASLLASRVSDGKKNEAPVPFSSLSSPPLAPTRPPHSLKWMTGPLLSRTELTLARRDTRKMYTVNLLRHCYFDNLEIRSLV